MSFWTRLSFLLLSYAIHTVTLSSIFRNLVTGARAGVWGTGVPSGVKGRARKSLGQNPSSEAARHQRPLINTSWSNNLPVIFMWNSLKSKSSCLYTCLYVCVWSVY